MELFQQFAAVCLVLALAGLAVYWLKRGLPGVFLFQRARAANPRRLEIVQRIALTAQHQLCLVRLDGKEWLIGVYPNGMTALSRPEWPGRPEIGPDRKES